jgi:hypothetical protein
VSEFFPSQRDLKLGGFSTRRTLPNPISGSTERFQKHRVSIPIAEDLLGLWKQFAIDEIKVSRTFAVTMLAVLLVAYVGAE